MVAPVDSKVELEVEGETIVLRLNFRSISLLEEAGLDLFSKDGFDMTLSRSAIMCRCLSITDHPDMTADEALAIVARTPADKPFAGSVLELIARFGGKPDEEPEGNVEAAMEKTPRPRRKTSSSSGAKPATRRTASGTKRRAASS